MDEDAFSALQASERVQRVVRRQERDGDRRAFLEAQVPRIPDDEPCIHGEVAGEAAGTGREHGVAFTEVVDSLADPGDAARALEAEHPERVAASRRFRRQQGHRHHHVLEVQRRGNDFNLHLAWSGWTPDHLARSQRVEDARHCGLDTKVRPRLHVVGGRRRVFSFRQVQQPADIPRIVAQRNLILVVFVEELVNEAADLLGAAVPEIDQMTPKLRALVDDGAPQTPDDRLRHGACGAIDADDLSAARDKPQWRLAAHPRRRVLLAIRTPPLRGTST